MLANNSLFSMEIQQLLTKPTLDKRVKNQSGNDNASRPGRPRSSEVHRSILKATLENLGELGYEKLSISSIAIRSGVGKATIYRRWPSKLPLVVDALNQLPELATPDTGRLLDDLSTLANEFIQIASSSRLAPILTAIGHESYRNHEFETCVNPLLQSRRRPLLKIISRAIARNEITPSLSIEDAADILMGPILTRVLFTKREPSYSETRYLLERLILGITSTANVEATQSP
ncbi:TetR/AcrR family transcriptional regulator [Denitratisoma oestradiolicum]|uniref:Uncharacterized protein n=1 Tax=Denitratisoma oestradiolicum TaxID=311182 RepID=A0A6S6Y782_9PROT|nr:TetR/AcrR family transcriptional regulator [Denitratisoma oestradiolicum]TWO78836.1 hypothetical protein CBW56_17940 [Denitratisoma oestradiolicum]CAB1368348.1 conserved protein of unknown function [Denitratisoma oestradiolicum]